VPRRSASLVHNLYLVVFTFFPISVSLPLGKVLFVHEILTFTKQFKVYLHFLFVNIPTVNDT